MTSNAIKLILASCLVGSLFYQYSQSKAYRTTIDTFGTTKTVSGVFTFTDGGKMLQSSWLDGRPIFWAASYAGGVSGFGRSFDIPNRSKVTATVVELQTQSGVVEVAASIRNDNKVFVDRTPVQLRDLWLQQSHFSLFSRGLFTFVAIVAPYLIITGFLSSSTAKNATES
jgi:hypothetical protein